MVMKDAGGYLDSDEIKKILSSIKDKDEKMLVKVLYNTGARISEIVGIENENKKRIDPLKKSRINFEKKTITLRNLKRKGDKKEWKTTYISPEFTKELKKYTKSTKKSHILFNYSRYKAFRIIRRSFKRAGFEFIGRKRAHPHHLRHSYVMRGINKSIPLTFIQQQTGHSELSSIGSYSKFKKKDIERNIKKMWSDED